jgi:hypothetical protein
MRLGVALVQRCRSHHADLETEVAQSRTKIILDGNHHPRDIAVAAETPSLILKVLEKAGLRAEGPSGRAKIRSDDPKHALSLVHYPRTIRYKAWIEDTNGNAIDETSLNKEAESPGPE